MTDAEVVELIKMDIGEPCASGAREIFLEHIEQSAKGHIEEEGYHFSSPTSLSILEADIISMYASYLIRKRDSGEQMPRSLRWCLNNAIFKQKIAK